MGPTCARSMLREAENDVLKTANGTINVCAKKKWFQFIVEVPWEAS